MPYTHFRFIAYEVPTATFKSNGPVISGWDPGKECAPVARLPVSKEVTDKDARNRLLRLAAVVDFALQKNTYDHATVLNIFVVPEFYFRPPIVNSNYAHNTYPDTVAMQIFNCLNEMFRHTDFKNWLIVCGTVMWNQKAVKSKPLYLNTAVFVNGGAVNLVEKRLPSHIDGVPVAMALGTDLQVVPILEDWKVRKQHVFTVDGIPFGIEVCLDHADQDGSRVLKNVLIDWNKNEPNQQEVRLQILTAGGMSIQPKSVVAKIGGYILRNDGLSNPPPHSEIQQVKGYTAKDLLGTDSTFNTTALDSVGSANLDPSASGFNRKVALPNDLQIKVPSGYKQFDQQVVYYSVFGMPV